MTLYASTSSRGSITLLLLVSATLHLCGAYNDHVPTSVCQSMTPSHRGAAPQTSASPYVLTASAACYVPGQALTVSLSGAGSSTSYMGLLVEARLSGSNTASYGTFSTNGDTDIQTLSCFGQANSAICHANNNLKLVKSFLWTPPSTINSPIEITATVLQSYTTFWTGLKTTVNVCAALSVSNVTDAPSSSSTNQPSTTTSLAPTDASSSSTSTPIVPSTPGYDTGSAGSSSSVSDSSSTIRPRTTTSPTPVGSISSSTPTPVVPSTSRVRSTSRARADSSDNSQDDSADSDDQSSEGGRYNKWNSSKNGKNKNGRH